MSVHLPGKVIVLLVILIAVTLCLFSLRAWFARQESLNARLIAAIEESDPDQVEALLLQGASPNAFEEPVSLKMHLRQYVSTVRRQPLDWNQPYGPRRALFVALRQHPYWTPHNRIVASLLRHGADVNICVEDGRTPLMQAVFCGDVALIRILLAYGADPWRTDAFGNTAYSLAKPKGYNRHNRRSVYRQVLLRYGQPMSLGYDQAIVRGYTMAEVLAEAERPWAAAP